MVKYNIFMVYVRSDIMKIMYELDDNNYIKTYGIYHELKDAKGNMYCPFKIGNGDTIEIDIDEQTLSNIYKAYQVIDGKLVFDKNKSTEVYEDNVIEPMPTIEDLMLQIEALNKRINELTNGTNNV